MLFQTSDILHGSDSPDALPPFWNFWATEKAWARITAESRMFLKVQSTFIIERPSNQCCCQWCFSNTLFQENSTYPWVYFFLRPIRPGNVNFMRHFFLNCGNPARPRSGINPERLAPFCALWVIIYWDCKYTSEVFLFLFPLLALHGFL